MIEHDENRELEVQILCKHIVETTLEFEDQVNGPYRKYCPFCFAEITGGHKFTHTSHSMEDVSHELDCPYLIAKFARRERRSFRTAHLPRCFSVPDQITPRRQQGGE